MASTGKRKTTMAKLQRERRLLERRIEKKAKKDARKRLPCPFVILVREVFFYGNRNRQVVQRHEGLRLHHA